MKGFKKGCTPWNKGRSLPKKIVTDRFDALVYESIDGCHYWLGFLDKDGYGHFSIATSKHILAHRFAYMLHFGDVIQNKLVLHRCDNPACVNPNHLFLGTQLDNMRDMIKKGRQNFIGLKMLQFKYKIGQEVMFNEECYKIDQLRNSYGRPYYRLNSGNLIISEMFLYA